MDSWLRLVDSVSNIDTLKIHDALKMNDSCIHLLHVISKNNLILIILFYFDLLRKRLLHTQKYSVCWFEKFVQLTK